MRCSETKNIADVEYYLLHKDSIISELYPQALESTLERYCFKSEPHISIKQLWELLTNYIYSLRLCNRSVLHDAIARGVREGVFGLADDVDEATGRYENLIFGNPIKIDSLDLLIVRKEEAEAQCNIPQPEPVDDTTSEEPIEIAETKPLLPHTFEMRLRLDAAQLSSEINRVREDIIEALNQLPNVEISIEMSIKARAADGIDDEVGNALEYNGKRFRVMHSRFGY